MDFLLPGNIFVKVEDNVKQTGDINNFLKQFKSKKRNSRPCIEVKKNTEFNAEQTVDEFGFLDEFIVFFDRFGNQAFVKEKGGKFEIFLDEDFIASYFNVQPLTWVIKKALNYAGGEIIHGAALSKGGEGFLFPAFPNTGKTSIALRLLGEGFDFIGDDKSIILNGKIYCFHPNITLLYYNFHLCPFLYERIFGNSLLPKARVKLSFKIRQWSNNHPTAIRFSDKFVFPAKTYPVEKIFPKVKVASSSELKNAFFLSKFKTRNTFDLDFFTEKVLNSNLFEFWGINKVEVILAAIKGGNYLKTLEKRKKIIRKNLKNVRLGELVVRNGRLTKESEKKLGLKSHSK